VTRSRLALAEIKTHHCPGAEADAAIEILVIEDPADWDGRSGPKK
jgi:hypothetical protein